MSIEDDPKTMVVAIEDWHDAWGRVAAAEAERDALREALDDIRFQAHAEIAADGMDEPSDDEVISSLYDALVDIDKKAEAALRGEGDIP